MAKNVSNEPIRRARRADLHDFLTSRHGGDFIREGGSIRPKNNHSISIRRGYCGYKDFATGETGNSIEFLTRHMGYGFVEAVQALAEGTGAASVPQPGITGVPPEFPAPVSGRPKNLFAFLMNRGIPAETIRTLIDRNLLYQEKSRNNIVFINAERDFAELRGTYTPGKPFHGVVPNCRHDGFWWFRTGKDAQKGYVCEAAIDRLKNSKLDITLAVDNDGAGQRCRDRNPGLPCILPQNKDWNEDLQAARC